MAEVPDFIREANEKAEIELLIQAANERARLEAMQHRTSSEQFGDTLQPDWVRDMSGWDRFLAGAKAQNLDAWDVLRMAPEEEIRSRIEAQKPLETWGGPMYRLGQIGTNVGQGIAAQLALSGLGRLVPGSIPGARAVQYMTSPSTIGGNVAAGAIQGALTDPLDPLRGAYQGAAGGGVGAGIGKALVGAGTAAKRMLDPLSETGQAQIIREYLERTSGMSADDLARGARSAPTYVPGSVPTLPEATGNIGLQRAMNAARTGRYSETFGQDVVARQAEQNKARLDMLYDLAAGNTPESRTEAIEAMRQLRDDITAPLREAFEQAGGPVDTTRTIATVNSLLAGPARKREGVASVLQNVKETLYDEVTEEVNGKTVKRLVPVEDAATLYNGVRKNIADLIEGKGRGAQWIKQNKQAIRDLETVLKSLDDDLGDVPGYDDYMQAYRQLSKHIDRRLTGGEIIKRTTSGSEWLGGEPSLKPDAYGNLFKDEGKATVKAATGFAANKGFRDLLEPRQYADLMAVKADLDRAATVAKAGRDIGSPTAELLAGQHVMEGALRPGGAMGDMLRESGIGRLVTRGVSLPYKMMDDDIARKLQQAYLDPAYAAEIMSRQGLLGPIPAWLRDEFPGLLGRGGSAFAVGMP